MRTNTLKNLIATTVIASACFIMMPTSAHAQITKQGSAGPNTTYEYDNITNNLTISGTGKIDDNFYRNALQGSISARKPNVVIESGITEIGTRAFEDNMGKLTIPSSVTKIGDYAFSGSFANSGSITIYANDIGTGSLSGLAATKELVIENATHIKASTISGTSNKIVLKKAVTIDDGALSYLNNSVVYLPTSLNSFGEITVPTNVMVYGYRDYATIPVMEATGQVDYFNYNGVHSMATATISGYEDEYNYTGSAIRPNVTVSYPLANRTLNLVAGTDYEVSYSNNTDIGNATITVTGKGYYSNSVNKTFEITGNIQNATVTLSKDSYIYNGSERTPEVTVVINGKTLTAGTDYDIAYTNNVNIGTATVTVTGKGYCKGSKSATFKITTSDISLATVTLNHDSFIYTGGVNEPIPTVILDDKTLVLNTDYTISYSDNINTGIAKITITGKGDYNNTKTVDYNIIHGDLSNATITLSQTSYDNDGTEKKPEVTVVLNDVYLVEGVDYTVAYTNNNTYGIATVTVTGINNIAGSKSANFTINRVYIPIDNAEITLAESVYSYDGSKKEPEVTSVVLNGKTLVAGTDYQIVYQNNINVGTGYVSVIGIGDYNGTASVAFNIIKGTENVYEAGETFISADFNYTVTDTDNHEIEFISTNKKSSTVVIPGKVTVDGVEYTVTSIAQKAFYKNASITSVTIPNTVKSIENYAFYGCTKLNTVKIGNGLEILGDNAFRKCTKLTSITLPKSIDELGKNAFYGCKKLSKIVIKSNEVVDIGANAFKGISTKATIDVPKKLVAKYRKACTKKTGYKKTMKIK